MFLQHRTGNGERLPFSMVKSTSSTSPAKKERLFGPAATSCIAPVDALPSLGHIGGLQGAEPSSPAGASAILRCASVMCSPK